MVLFGLWTDTAFPTRHPLPNLYQFGLASFRRAGEPQLVLSNFHCRRERHISSKSNESQLRNYREVWWERYLTGIGMRKERLHVLKTPTDGGGVRFSLMLTWTGHSLSRISKTAHNRFRVDGHHQNPTFAESKDSDRKNSADIQQDKSCGTSRSKAQG